MNMTAPFARLFRRTAAQTASEAADQIRGLADMPEHVMLPQSKVAVLGEIRRDIRQIMEQHDEIASLSGHPGWERLCDIMRRYIIGRLQNWRSELHTDPAQLQINEVWADAAETIMRLQRTEFEQYDEAARLNAMTDAELVRHAVAGHGDEEEQKAEESNG